MLSLKTDPNYDVSFPSNKSTENISKNELHSLDFFSPVNSNVNIMNLANFYDNNRLNYNNNSKSNIDILNKKNINSNKGQKKTLVLDLDETLVHSAMTPFPYKNNIVLTINYEGKNYTIYVIKRPFLDTFLNEMSNIYDLIIFTASIGQYSDLLLNFIDKKKVIKNVLNRDNCIYYEGGYLKDLRIINKDFKDIIIIDNNPISYAFNKDNGIPIKSWFDDPNDNELIKLIPFLKILSKVNDVRPFIKSAINQQSGQLDFSYINKLQDNVNKLNSILNKNLNNNNINLNTGLMNNNVDEVNINKDELNPNIGLIINNNNISNNNQINKNINNINLIDKMNININNNFEKINIIYHNNNKFNSRTLNQNESGKSKNKNNSSSPNLNKKEKKNIYNKIHVEKITNKNLNTQDESNKTYNVIVKKLTNFNSYEKFPNNKLNIYEKNSPIYSKYDSGNSYYQEGIEENRMDNENKMMVERDTFVLIHNNKDNFISQNNAHLLKNPNLNYYKKINNSKPINKANLTKDSHTIKEKSRNDSNIFEFKNLNEELTNEKVQTKYKNINGKSIKINKVNSNTAQKTANKNINPQMEITPLRIKTPDDAFYNTTKVNPIKHKILFNDEKYINNNYHLTKNEASSCKKNKIIVMKIIRTNSKKAHLSYSSNESKFNLTYNSIKDNKNFKINARKFKKINLKLNQNDKLCRYLYNPLDSILNTKLGKYEKGGNIPLKKTHKNSANNNNNIDNKNNFGLSQNLFKKKII